MKVCSRCEVEKEIFEFYRDNRSKDGLRSWCIRCISEDSRSREHKYKETRKVYSEKSKTKAAINKRRVYEKDEERRKKINEANRAWQKTVKGRFASYKRGARNRDLPFELSFKQFEDFWGKPCEYCGDKIETIGLDRVNPEAGYTLDNVKSCCTICNRMKLNHSLENWLIYMSKVLRHLEVKL